MTTGWAKRGCPKAELVIDKIAQTIHEQGLGIRVGACYRYDGEGEDSIYHCELTSGGTKFILEVYEALP